MAAADVTVAVLDSDQRAREAARGSVTIAVLIFAAVLFIFGLGWLLFVEGIDTK